MFKKHFVLIVVNNPIPTILTGTLIASIYSPKRYRWEYGIILTRFINRYEDDIFLFHDLTPALSTNSTSREKAK